MSPSNSLVPKYILITTPPTELKSTDYSVPKPQHTHTGVGVSYNPLICCDWHHQEPSMVRKDTKAWIALETRTLHSCFNHGKKTRYRPFLVLTDDLSQSLPSKCPWHFLVARDPQFHDDWPRRILQPLHPENPNTQSPANPNRFHFIAQSPPPGTGTGASCIFNRPI